jgi:hypothetical protein
MQDAARWWATQGSAEQANRWLAGIDERLQDESPERYPLAPENDDFPFEMRELYFGVGRRPTHRAVFTTADDLVVVLSVRHLSQNRLQPDDLT